MLLAASLDYEATLADLGRAARSAARRLLHRRRDRRGRAQPAPGRHLPPRPRARGSCCASSGTAIRRSRTRRIPSRGAARPASRYLVEDARDEALARAAVDEEHLALYHALERCPYIVVPLEARGRLLGTISLGTGESGRRFGPLDLELAREIARRAALRSRTRFSSGAAQRVVRPARHAARLGAGGDRLLGPRAPLRPRQRRARRRSTG